MRNKVEIRAFAVEQVVKMRCMSDCTIEDVVEQAKLIEAYVVSEAQLSEDDNELSEMRNLFKDFMTQLEESRKQDSIRAWEIARSVPSEEVMGYCLKPNEA
jgi:hypothetical protein